MALDLLVKQWFQVRLAVVWNDAGVWGTGKAVSWLWLGLILVGITAWWWCRVRRPMQIYGLGLILAGGIGNLADRIRFGAVRDYIQYSSLGVTGNLADIYLGMGVLVLLWDYWRHRREDD